MNEKFKKEIAESKESVSSKVESNNSSDAQRTLLDDVQKVGNEKVAESLPNGDDNRASKTGAHKTEQQNTNEEGKGSENTQKEQKIEKRGRKPMSVEEKAEAKRKRDLGEGKSTNASEDLRKDLGGYKTTTIEQATQGAPNPQNIDISKYITGALVLIAMDSIFPTAILFIAGFVDKKYKGLDKKKLKLDPTEKKELEPLADEVVKIMFGMVHPVTAFLVVTSIIYFGKLESFTEEDFKKAESKRFIPKKEAKK